MKVNKYYEQACQSQILKTFLSLPSLALTAAHRPLDDTAGIYGFEAPCTEAHQYVLTEEYPLQLRCMSSFLITNWSLPDTELRGEIAAGHRLKAFAIIVGVRSRWVVVFNLDEVLRRRKREPGRAVSVESLMEVWFCEGRGRGEWGGKRERSKLVYVPETDDWFFTWPLAALAAFGVLEE
jgi:hypothetical protein